MMSSNVALLHSNNCCVLEPAICEDLDLHVVIYLRNSLTSQFYLSMLIIKLFLKDIVMAKKLDKAVSLFP